MEGGGARVRAEPGRRPRLTLLDQMSAIAADGREHSGLTLDDILNSQKRVAAAATAPPPPPPPPPETLRTPGRTLLDVIRDEDPKASSFKEFGSRDRKSWRSFKDRIRLSRSGSGAAWTSSVHVPTSDIMIPTSRSLVARGNSVRSLFSESPPRRRSLEMAMSQSAENESDGESSNNNNTAAGNAVVLRPQISRRTSCRFGAFPSFSDQTDGGDDAEPENGNGGDNNNRSPSPGRRGGLQAAPSLRPQISRRHSARFSPAIDGSAADATEPPQPRRDGSRRLSAVLAEERSLSAREAVAAQEAAEAASAAAAVEEEVSPAATVPARMSLMDLLEETDRQMGLVGSRYLIGDDDDDDYEEDEEEAAEIVCVGGGATAEQNCCVCMVRHKGAAFIPCGHTFCRLCSRELWVSRGNCPLCNGFILEILDIF